MFWLIFVVLFPTIILFALELFSRPKPNKIKDISSFDDSRLRDIALSDEWW